MNTLKVAIQKSGRLSQKSLDLLSDCGIKISNGGRKLVAEAKNFPLKALYLRDDDIPQYVDQGVADVGILGLNEVLEQGRNIKVIRRLGFSNCRLELAVPKDIDYRGLSYFNGKRIATSYPKILKEYLTKANINAEIEELSGSVEIATGIGLADGICDLVSTGSTLIMNGLVEVETILQSEAVLVARPNLPSYLQILLDKLLFRLNAVSSAKENKYILLNTPNSAIAAIQKILPGMKSPTILPLSTEGWSSLHSVIREDEFWDNIDRLKEAGAEGILVCPIEKMIL